MRHKGIRRILALFCRTTLLAAAVVIAVAFRPLRLAIPRVPFLPAPFLRDGRWIVQYPADALAAEVVAFRDKLTAYLHFDYLRSRRASAGSPVLLAVTETSGGPTYHVSIAFEKAF
jgi:hypothetical protein